MKLFSILITTKPETNPTAPAVLLRDFSTILGVSWWGGDPKMAWVMFLQDWSLWEKFCDVDLLNAVLMLHHPAPWISRMWLFGHWEDPSTHFVTHWGLCPTANMDGNGSGSTWRNYPWALLSHWLCVTLGHLISLDLCLSTFHSILGHCFLSASSSRHELSLSVCVHAKLGSAKPWFPLGLVAFK